MLKDFKMDELRIICAIAETASVSRAAQRLNMPQSNVSRTLTSVERKVGLAIFLRTARELVRTGVRRAVYSRQSRGSRTT